jgi:hypothetical protein
MACLTRGSVRFALIAFALAVPACVGDDPPLDAGAVTPENDAGTPPPSGPSDSGAADTSTLTCPKDLGDCDGRPSNGCETSLVTPDNCGSCGHACGGNATCVDGQCTAETLSSTLDHPFGLAIAGQRALWLSPNAVWGCTLAGCSASTTIMVDIDSTTNLPVPGASFSPRQIAIEGTNFYYEKCSPGAGGDCAPAECPITGCKAGGPIGGSTILRAGSGFHHATNLFGGPSAVYTQQASDGLQRFSLPLPSTDTSLNVGIVDYFGGAHVDAQNFVYVDDDPSLANPNGGLFVCPASGCVGGRGATLVPPPIRLLAFGDGSAITTSGGATNLANASILGCAITGCGGAGTVLATSQAYVSDVVADDKDVFWATVGAADPTTNAAAVGTIMRCSLPSCAGGPQKIADQVVNPVGVQIDADYVYWITYGTAASQNGAIVRRRR